MTETREEGLDERVEAVRKLLQEFKVERYIYISVIVICLLVLVYSVTVTIGSDFNTATVISIFGPSGVIVTMAGRLLTMWDRATQLVMQGGGS